MSLNSQHLKQLFSDRHNDKEYEVVVYTAFNEYPIKEVIMDGDKIIIVTEEIGQLLSDSKDSVEIDEGPMVA